MKKSRNEVTVGFFVILGFILLTLIVFFVSGVYFFRSGYNLSVMYDYVSILDKGSPVRMAGVRVGEVSKVELVFDENMKRMRVKVRLFIEKSVEIRENYVFKIQGTHVLSEPHIEISPKSGNEPLLRSDRTIEGLDPVPVENIIEQSEKIATNVAKLSESLNQVMDESGGDLKSAIKNMGEASGSLNKVLGRFEKGEGTVGKLVKEDALYQDMRGFVAEIKAHPWRLLKKDNEKKKFLFF